MLIDGRWSQDAVMPAAGPGLGTPLRDLCDLMQEAAGGHVLQLGLSVPELRARNLTWMLSRFLIRVTRYPEPGEPLIATTWPSGVARLFALREFRLTTRDGEPVGVATSAWLLFDLAARRPVRPDGLIAGLPLRERALDVTFGKLEDALTPEWSLERAVQAEDIDVNGHVTNTAYIGWMEEGARGRLSQGQDISELEIHFLAEVFRDDRVRIEGEDPSLCPSRCALRVLRSADASAAARAVMCCAAPVA